MNAVAANRQYGQLSVGPCNRIIQIFNPVKMTWSPVSIRYVHEKWHTEYFMWATVTIQKKKKTVCLG